MKPFFWLRILALLKRATLALESLAESQRAIALAAAPAKKSGKPKVAGVFTPSIEDQNREWQRRQDAEIFGEEISE